MRKRRGQHIIFAAKPVTKGKKYSKTKAKRKYTFRNSKDPDLNFDPISDTDCEEFVYSEEGEQETSLRMTPLMLVDNKDGKEQLLIVWRFVLFYIGILLMNGYFVHLVYRSWFVSILLGIYWKRWT